MVNDSDALRRNFPVAAQSPDAADDLDLEHNFQETSSCKLDGSNAQVQRIHFQGSFFPS